MSLQIIEKSEIGAIAQNENKIETKPLGLGFGEHDVILRNWFLSCDRIFPVFFTYLYGS